jgi:hypothetical protein
MTAMVVLDDHRVTIGLILTLFMVVIGVQVIKLLLVFNQRLNVASILFYGYTLLLSSWFRSYNDLGGVVRTISDGSAVRLLISCLYVLSLIFLVLVVFSVWHSLLKISM